MPFDVASFEVVFHVGGINFFNNQEATIQEMIRVAKPGTKILIVDETDEGIRQYKKTPGLSLLIRSERQATKAPVDLVPPEMMRPSLTKYTWLSIERSMQKLGTNLPARERSLPNAILEYFDTILLHFI